MSAFSRAAVRAHHLNDWLDEDGRPLGEHAAPAALYAPVQDEVRCPYAGGRQGRPMNRAALRQLVACWPSLLETVRALSVPGATVHGAWRAATAAVIAPLLLPRPTPRRHAALYKACVGFHQCFTFLLLADGAVADTPLGQLSDAEGFAVWLEREGWLIGRDQVCAGTAHQIAALYTAFCGHGSAAGAGGWAAIPGWEAATEQAMRWQAEALRERIADPEGALSASKAPWLVAGTLRPEQRPEDAVRLWPAGLRAGGAGAVGPEERS